MNWQLLEAATREIPSQPVLINIVSKRVRQLGAGHRPLIEADPWMSFADIALREVAEKKITVGESGEPEEAAL